MAGRLNKIIMVFILFSIFANAVIAEAKSNNEITFKDKNLQSALSKYYDWSGAFSIEDASNLSNTNHSMIVLENLNISDLEGLQYFTNLKLAYLSGNALENLKPLSKLIGLGGLDVSNNSVKGIRFENALKDMGKFDKLSTMESANNGLSNIEILDSIGNIENYYDIDMEGNKISDISILKRATTLAHLDLSDNRITDVTPLKNLKKLTWYLDLRDNCIINYKPIKPLLDEMFSDPGHETGLERYDYYSNPVNFKYKGKTIKFPYLSAYYKYQAYAEAIPLFKALGGSATYNKKTGTLTCKYIGKVLVFKDFSEKYTLNGKEKSLKYPMRRMQYDLAYVPVKDICEVLGLKYKVTKKRVLADNERVFARPPKIVEISMQTQ